MANLLTQFEEIFNDSPGTVKDTKTVLSLKPNAIPKFVAPRPIPYALKPLIEQEIRRLEAEGTWEKVLYSDWGTPLVPRVKKDNNIRLCGDYKMTLTPQ